MGTAAVQAMPLGCSGGHAVYGCSRLWRAVGTPHTPMPPFNATQTPSCFGLQVKKKYYEQKRAQQHEAAAGALLPAAAAKQQQHGLQLGEAGGEQLIPAVMPAGSGTAPASPAVSAQGSAAASPAKLPLISPSSKASLPASGKASPAPLGLSVGAF